VCVCVVCACVCVCVSVYIIIRTTTMMIIYKKSILGKEWTMCLDMGLDVDKRSREEGSPDFYLKQKNTTIRLRWKKTTNRLYSYMTANRRYIIQEKKQDGCWHRAELIEYECMILRQKWIHTYAYQKIYDEKPIQILTMFLTNIRNIF